MTSTNISPDALTLEMIYTEPSIIGTRPMAMTWSPDGSQLAFLWNDAGHTFRDIWVWDRASGTTSRRTNLGAGQVSGEPKGITELAWLAGGRLAFALDGEILIVAADGAVTPFTTGAHGASALAASPDGSKLAFIAGGALLQVGETGGTPTRLVGSAAFVTVESFQWAAAGDRIVFVEADDTNTRKIEIAYDARGEARRDRFTRSFPGDLITRRRVGVVSAAGGEALWFDRPDAEDAIWDYGISRDGSTVFIDSSDLSIKNHTVFTFDTHSAERTVFYAFHDPIKIRPDWQVAFAPDDKGLLLLTDRDGFNHLYLIPAAGAEPEAITEGEWEIANFALDRGNGEIYFTANIAHPAQRHVYKVALDGGDVTQITQAPGIHVPAYAPGFDLLADIFSDDMTPAEIFVQPLVEDAEPRQITSSPLPAFAKRRWAEVRYVPFKSSVDGAELMARVMVPHGFEPHGGHPMIVGSVYSDGLLNQWGGRAAHPSWGIDQYLVSRGFVVVSPEIRGSFGRGREWNRPMLHSYGTQDIEDIADCVKTLTGLGYANPKRVGIWGSSYGGLMTLMSLFNKPGFYAAGVAGAPATNVWHAYPEQEWIMGPTHGADYPQRYKDQSALFHTAGLEDALMIVHGTRDEVVLYADTMAVVERLTAQRKWFELVTLPGTGHAWANQDRTLTRFAYGKLARFFERELKG
ncbi:hypothetical protein JP74_14555 [Devosia sp. 17-2-E-8]|nr:hypothetical protein JP74_14555 [Devosia sp. 17-2-E-8]